MNAVNNAMPVAEEYEKLNQPDDAGNRECFVVTDIGKAEWAIKKIKYHTQKKEEAAEFVKAEKAKLDAYLAEINADHDKDIEYFKELLRSYALDQLQGTKQKTVKLPSGSLSFRSVPPRIEKDEELLLAFTKECYPEMVVVTESVKWGELKKQLKVMDDGRMMTEDGVIVEGVTATVMPDSFAVKLNGEK